MKRKEKWILAGIVLTAVLFMGIQYFFAPEGREFEVTVNGNLYGSYSLMSEQEISVGEHNVIQVLQGKVRMLEAECPDKLCVKQGWIGKQGESIVCLPNQVVVTVTEGERNPLDAVVQ